MNDNRIFYHIYSAAMEHCELTEDAEAKAHWICPGCLSPKPGTKAVDVELQRRPGKQTLQGISAGVVAIASRTFLQALGDEVVERDLYVGKVYGPQGEEYTDWATVRGKYRTIVRGKKHAGVRRCDQCGRDVYFAMDKKYLYPAPPQGISLFESHVPGLILSEEIFFKADVKKWRGIYIDKLHIADVPDDSLGELIFC